MNNVSDISPCLRNYTRLSPTRFSSRVFRTLTELSTRMLLPCKCFHGVSGWHHPRSSSRMKASLKETMLRRKRRKW